MEEEIKKEVICKREVFDNIQRVREGRALTKPLKLLNQFCEFKKEWDNVYDLTHEEQIKRERTKQKKAYYEKNKDKLKAYFKAYGEKNKDKDKIKKKRMERYWRLKNET